METCVRERVFTSYLFCNVNSKEYILKCGRMEIAMRVKRQISMMEIEESVTNAWSLSVKRGMGIILASVALVIVCPIYFIVLYSNSC